MFPCTNQRLICISAPCDSPVYQSPFASVTDSHIFYRTISLHQSDKHPHCHLLSAASYNHCHQVTRSIGVLSRISICFVHAQLFTSHKTNRLIISDAGSAVSEMLRRYSCRLGYVPTSSPCPICLTQRLTMIPLLLQVIHNKPIPTNHTTHP